MERNYRRLEFRGRLHRSSRVINQQSTIDDYEGMLLLTRPLRSGSSSFSWTK